jgi:hypothetical protein
VNQCLGSVVSKKAATATEGAPSRPRAWHRGRIGHQPREAEVAVQKIMLDRSCARPDAGVCVDASLFPESPELACVALYSWRLDVTEFADWAVGDEVLVVTVAADVDAGVGVVGVEAGVGVVGVEAGVGVVVIEAVETVCVWVLDVLGGGVTDAVLTWTLVAGWDDAWLFDAAGISAAALGMSSSPIVIPVTESWIGLEPCWSHCWS